MYGNITKRLVLNTYVEEQLKDHNRHALFKITANDFVNLFKPNKRKTVDRFIAVLKHEGYLAVEKNADGPVFIKITGAGLSAQGANLFKIKQDELIKKGVINFLMTGSTVAVAIITIVTLLRGDKQIDALREEVEQLRTRQQVMQGGGSPNVIGKKNGH